nr:hypothetical protein [Tanacetum cinerariifolium]
MGVDIEEDENEPELTYPYEEMDPFNPPPPASESKHEDVTEVENPIKQEDETVPASVHEVGESSTSSFLREDSDGLFSGLMRRDINSLFNRMASLSRRLCGRETAHALVKKRKSKGRVLWLGSAEDKVECKKLKKKLKEARIMPPKSAPLNQAAIRRMIKESVDAAIAVELEGNARSMVTAPTDGNVSSGSLPLCEHCFTCHVGMCTIKCHKCGKVRHKARCCKEKNVATGANAQSILNCYDYGEQGYTRNRCLRNVKQEEVEDVRGRAYSIKDAEHKGLIFANMQDAKNRASIYEEHMRWRVWLGNIMEMYRTANPGMTVRPRPWPRGVAKPEGCYPNRSASGTRRGEEKWREKEQMDSIPYIEHSFLSIDR